MTAVADTPAAVGTRPAAPPFAGWIGWLLLGCGLVGAGASFVLVVERIALLENPFYVPSCSVDAVLSCASVMTSAQSELFGFPNPLLGLVGFPVVATVGVAAIGRAAGRSLWLGLQVGTLLGVVFVHWLIGQSLYAIGALCPYCMVVWVVTITAFWYTTLHNLSTGMIPVPAGLRRVVDAAVGLHGAVLAVWLVVVAALVLARFWAHWAQLTGL